MVKQRKEFTLSETSIEYLKELPPRKASSVVDEALELHKNHDKEEEIKLMEKVRVRM